MVRVLVASGGHKDFLSPLEACAHIARGLKAGEPSLEIETCPMADGGDGTTDALVAAHGGVKELVSTHDALFRARQGELGLYEDLVPTGVLEIAQAAGSALLQPHERQTMVATSFGVGELILAAVALGCRRVVVGLGGSIVTDGGMGMAQALGYVFLDARGRRLEPVCNPGFNALSLMDVAAVRDDDLKLDPADLEVLVASDVDIPLLGPGGQARTFGPQKGASPLEIDYLERGLANLAQVMRRSLAKEVDLPLAGAAGGLGAGLVGFLGGGLYLGAELVARETGLADKVERAELVVVGEGKLDSTTALDKAPYYAARLACQRGKMVVALVGMQDRSCRLEFFPKVHACREHDRPQAGEVGPALEELARRVAPLLAGQGLEVSPSA